MIPEVSRTEASNWHDTDWNYVNKKVFNLQKQIAKVEREGRGGKVKRLQNLLTRSIAAKRLAVRRVTENQDTVIMLALKKGLSRLEPCVGKLTSTVLRGGRPGNGSLLPDFMLKLIQLLIQGIYWILYNFVRVHFTTKHVPVVALSIIEQGFPWQKSSPTHAFGIKRNQCHK